MADQTTIEERVNALEAKVSRLLEKETPSVETPWWAQWFGAFQDSPSFDDAMRRGAQYRQSQPNPADDPEALEV